MTARMRTMASVALFLPAAGVWGLGATAVAQESSPVLDEAFQAQLDAETSSQRVGGCEAVIRATGPEAWADVVSLVTEATDHLNIETLEVSDNEHGRASMTLFAEAATRGVQVQMIVDPIDMMIFSSMDMFNFLEAAGGVYREYWPPDRMLLDKLLYRLHKKILVADGRRAITGGMNFGSQYYGPDQWYDINVLLTGPIVKHIQDDFIRDWIEQEGWPDGTPDLGRYYPELQPTGAGVVRYVDQRPAVGDREVNILFERLFQQASRSIVMETAYFLPNGRIQRLLRSARQRGVEVTILTNGRSSNDLGDLLFLPSTLTFPTLIDAGVNLYVWEVGKGHTMHAKALVVDDVLAVLGSYNVNNRSYDWDTENVVVLTEPNHVAALRNQFARDFALETNVRVDQEWLDRLTFMDRFIAMIFNVIARFL